MIDFEPTHYATEPRGRAVCGAPLAHPFNVSTHRGMVECKACLRRLAAGHESAAGKVSDG